MQITFMNSTIPFLWRMIIGHIFVKTTPTMPFQKFSLSKKYSDFIPNENILKVLDIGANYGYFSLWLQSKRSQDKIHSTLIEPSLRCSRSLEKLIKLPRLQNRFQYLQRAVGNPEKPRIKFLIDRSWRALFSNLTVKIYLIMPVL